jgi:hypothetical protein
MSTAETTHRCLANVIARLTETLATHGFLEAPEVETLARVKFVFWKKSYHWKIHSVRLSHRIGDERFIGVSLQVLLPRGTSGEPHLLDQIEVGALLGHPGKYSLPHSTDPLGLFCKFVTSKITRDVAAAIPWFSEYASAQACLGKLIGNDTMHGPARGPIYQEMTTYLEKLIERGEGQ